MCNHYRLRIERWEYRDYFDAIEDQLDGVTVEKDYAAPGKPGYVVRLEDGVRTLSAMKWGFPTRKPRRRPAREGEMPFLHDWWTNCRNLSNNVWKSWLNARTDPKRHPARSKALVFL